VSDRAGWLMALVAAYDEAWTVLPMLRGRGGLAGCSVGEHRTEHEVNERRWEASLKECQSPALLCAG